MKTKLSNPLDCISPGLRSFLSASEEEEADFADALTKYGELCAKYGAKSIRYQVIELIQEYLDDSEAVENLINKIHNLKP